LFAAADNVAALLIPDGGKLWPFLLDIARYLIDFSRDDDDDIATKPDVIAKLTRESPPVVPPN